MYKFSINSEKKLNTIDEKLSFLANEVIKISEIDIGILWGLRNENQQKELFDRGYSMCDGINNRSKHQDGLALDFGVYIDGKLTWEKKYYYYIVGLFYALSKENNINIKCGVFFENLEDCGHIELKNDSI